jgi:hypothetical protein
VFERAKIVHALDLAATVIGQEQDGRGIGFRVQIGARFSPLHVVQTGSGVHSASYPMGTVGSFPGGKAAEA